MLVHIFGAISFKAAYILHITSFWGSAASLKDTWTDLFLSFFCEGGGFTVHAVTVYHHIATYCFLVTVTLLAKQKKAQKVQFYIWVCVQIKQQDLMCY